MEVTHREIWLDALVEHGRRHCRVDALFLDHENRRLGHTPFVDALVTFYNPVCKYALSTACTESAAGLQGAEPLVDRSM